MVLIPPGPSLADRINRLEERLNAMETSTGTAKTGTDCSMQGSHDRLDSLMGIGCAGANFEDAHPASPSAYDDEFDDGSVAAKWGVSNPNSLSYSEGTDWPGWFSLRFTAASQSFTLGQTVSYGASTSLRFIARASFMLNNIDQWIRMYALDADPSNNGFAATVGRDATGIYIHFMRQTSGAWNEVDRVYLLNWGGTFTFGLCRTTANQWCAVFAPEGLSYVVTAVYTQSQSITKVSLNWVMGTTFGRAVRTGVDWFRSYAAYPWP